MTLTLPNPSPEQAARTGSPAVSASAFVSFRSNSIPLPAVSPPFDLAVLQQGYLPITLWPRRGGDRAGTGPRSGFALPAARFVPLPIGALQAPALGLAPLRPRRPAHLRVPAVGHPHDAGVVRGIGGNGCALDQEAHRRTIGIAVVYGQQNRLLACLAVAPGAVRQKAIIGVGPQVRVERVDPLLGGRLHHDAPAALERALKQRRQHALDRLTQQMIEQDLGHGPPGTI